MPGRGIPVIVDGKRYESIKEAAEAIHADPRAVSRGARGLGGLAGRARPAEPGRAKRVPVAAGGVRYGSVKECAAALGASPASVCRHMRRPYRTGRLAGVDIRREADG